ncbi:pseudouridylate synthase TRUB2, mitochondrial-like [Palaemon carinicauda]|uniref:pseudouridylate synthase TRUB2, mitochondrial-like n=1 Tax=Palaemon carinicauda TaxID=392227 RepID=UPI0035B60EA4
MQKVISYGPEAWKVLQGVFCVYKPFDMTISHLKKVLINNLTRDLNMLEPRPAVPYIVIEGNTADDLAVVKRENYADHPLAIGPRYQIQDLKLSFAIHLHKNISGVCLMGVNRGTKGTHAARTGRLIRSYSLEGRLGQATDTGFHNGKVVTKATYGHVNKSKIQKTLMHIQAGHQQSAIHFLGLDPQSQAAYEALSADGLVRPGEKSPPLIYSIKLTQFNPPDFTIEVACINENGEFLQHLVHKIGLQLKTNAVCTQMRCIRFGPWTLQHALLRKHWTLKHIIDNMSVCHPLVKNITPVSPSLQHVGNESLDNSIPR